MNDTVFKSHSILYVLIQLIFLVRVCTVTNSIVGFGACFHNRLYIPSYLFRMVVKRDFLMKNGILYSPDVENIMNCAFFDHEYSEAVDSWLSPNNFLKGWYQAYPGKPL